ATTSACLNSSACRFSTGGSPPTPQTTPIRPALRLVAGSSSIVSGARFRPAIYLPASPVLDRRSIMSAKLKFTATIHGADGDRRIDILGREAWALLELVE